MKTTLLLIPFKKTEEVNWTKPLNNYLLSIYGSTSDYQKDLEDFNKLRLDIRGVSADLTGIKLHLRYFSQLELLDLRIPVAAVNKHKKLTFTWYDAFLPTSQHKQHALPFEKASVLFNLSSLLSKAALVKYSESQRSSMGEDGSFKQSVQYLQQAAGVLQFILENFLHAPLGDLQPPTVKFLINLCLSQSQEIFTLKVIDGDLEQKKNSLISKLCKATANHYHECYAVCAHLLTSEGASSVKDHSTFSIVEAGLDDVEIALGSGDEEGNVDDEYNPDKLGMPETKVTAKLDHFWISVIQFKQIYYESLSYYFQGLQLEATNKFGEAIAYLTKSLELINEISATSLKVIAKAGGEDAYDLLDNYKYQKDALGIKLKDLTKDNDLIYHDIIPSTVTIAEPKPMDSAKVIPLNKIEIFSQINEYNYDNFLKNVVPINIHELLSYYSEEKSQLLRNELDELDVSNKELSTFLEHLKLPKALTNIKEIIRNNKDLESEESDESISPEILAKADEISSRYSTDLENRKIIAEIRDAILRTISESEGLLSGQYSVSLARYRDDLIKLKKSLYDAAASDSKLFALVDFDNSELYKVLGKGPLSAEFKNLFHVPDSKPKQAPVEEVSLLDMDEPEMQPKNDPLDAQIKKLEDILFELNSIKNKKVNLIEDLKKEIHNDDIADILMLNSKVKSTNEIRTVIFPKELEKFNVYSHELDKLISRQLDLSSDLKERWTQLTANPKVKEVQKLKTFRDELFRTQSDRIDNFYGDHWKKYTIGLSKGTEFYTQLLKFAENLKRTVQNEVSQLSINESFSNLNLQANSTGGSQVKSSQSFFQPSQSYSQSGHIPQHSGEYLRPAAFPPQARQNLQPYVQPRQNLQTQYQHPGQNFQAPSQPLQPQFLGFHSERQPPALPPKAPSQPIKPQNSGRIQGSNTKSAQGSTGLIYDQPSAYQPDMYNYFLQQGGQK